MRRNNFKLKWMPIWMALLMFCGQVQAQCPLGESTCLVTIECGDMFGDGWNGGALQVWQDTVLRGTVSLSTGYEGSYHVPVCTGDTMRFVWIAGPLDYEISFSIINGDGSEIAEVMPGGVTSGTVVAEGFPACPSCVHPIDLTCQPDSTYAMVTWTPVGDESYWLVYLNGSMVATTNVPSYYITGLTMNNDYTVGVRALCGSGDTSDVTESSFRTSCPPMELPYYNTFDRETPSELPACWNAITTFGNYPQVSDEEAYSDSLGLIFGAAGWNIVTTPLVPVPGNEIIVNFRAKLENGIDLGGFYLFAARLRVGVMTDLYDTSTFIPMVDIRTMDNVWRDYEFSTANLDPTASYYVAFFFKGTDVMLGNGFVDDLSITHDNGCHRPERVDVDSVGSRWARLSWPSAGDSAQGYYVYYSRENNAFGATFYDMVGDTTVVLRGLDQGTTYYAWVRSACDQDTSNYKASAPFTTAMTCARVTDVRLENVHYTAALLGWQYDNLNGSPAQGAWVRLYDQENPTIAIFDTLVNTSSVVLTGLTPGHSYSAYINSICLTDDQNDTANSAAYTFMTNSCSEVAGDGSTASSVYFVNTNLNCSYAQTLYRTSEMPNIDTIRGIAYRTSTGVSEPLGITLYMGNTTLNSLSETNYVPLSGLTAMATDYVVSPDEAGWQIIRFDTPFVRDTLSNLVVAVNHSSSQFTLNPAEWYYHSTPYDATVMWHSFAPISPANPSSMFGSTVLQGAVDVRFLADCQVADCLAPMVVDVEADSTSLTLTWIEEGLSAMGYLVQYRPLAAATYISAGSTTGTSHTIAGLNPATNYVIRVGALCQGDTLWEETNAVTDCGRIQVPYTENFDNYANGVMPPCWNYSRGVVDHRFGGLYWQPTSGIRAAVLPEFEYPVNRLEINLRALMSPMDEGEGIMVGVTDEGGTFIDWLDTLTDEQQSLSRYVWLRYDFRDYSGYGNRIVLAHKAVGLEAVVDDITVSEAVGCLPATQIVAHNLLNASNIVISWNNPSLASRWQVAWDTVGTNVSMATGNAVVTDTFYTLPPLTSGGKYTIYVKTLCDMGESAWRSLDFAAGSVVMPFVGTDTVTGCRLIVYDHGGMQYDYNHMANSTLVIRPTDSTHALQIVGGTVDLCPWGGDTLRIYEGEGTSGTLLYSVSSTYGPESLGVALTSETGAMTIQFVAHSGLSASGFELFTACVEASPCQRPRNVTVNVTSPTSATASWSGSALNYEVSYRPVGTASWQRINVTASPLTLTGLASGTRYELFVNGYCAGGQASPASTQVNFTTLCDAYTVETGAPIEESFESAEFPATCFTVLKAPGNPNSMSHSTNRAYAGSASFCFSSYNRTSDYNQYLISPMLNSADSITFRFRYSDMMYGQEKMRVGYSVTGNSPEDFVWTDTLTTNGITWKLFSRDFPSSAKFLAINYCSDWRYYAFVDSLRIGVVASADCQAPIIANLSEESDRIVVDFIAGGTVEAYITDQAWNDNVTGVTVSGTQHIFSGLQPNTMYTIGLRNHCASGINSHWTTQQVVTASEGCPAPTDFALDQEGYTSATFSWNGNGSAWEINVFNLIYNRSFTVTQSPFTVEGLDPGVTYRAKIRTLCDGMPGNWSQNIITFTTATCEPVWDVESEILDRERGVVMIRWQGQGGPYQLQYGYQHFGTDDGTSVDGITDNFYRIEGLDPEEDYDVYVRTQCAENSFSIWSNRCTITFNTTAIDRTQEGPSAYLYPNPAKESVTLTLAGVNDHLTVQVMDMAGRTVMQLPAQCHEGCNIPLQLKGLRQGMYFVQISGSQVHIVKKLIVR